MWLLPGAAGVRGLQVATRVFSAAVTTPWPLLQAAAAATAAAADGLPSSACNITSPNGQATPRAPTPRVSTSVTSPQLLQPFKQPRTYAVVAAAVGPTVRCRPSVSKIPPGRSLTTTACPRSDSSSGVAVLDREGPMALYNKGVQEGMYRRDPRQANTVMKLQCLYDQLSDFVQKPNMGRRRKSGLTLVDHVPSPASPHSASKPKASWWQSVVEGIVSGGSEEFGSEEEHGATQRTVHGLYMHGGVGCGKTMLMDLFVSAAPPEFKVVRTHFHDFMLGVHSKLRQYKDHQDPLLQVADKIAQTCRVLAMDEFFVTDVADAAILNRLFSRLWDRGLVLVATSNRAPDKLYEGGLQRNLFMPFIQRLKVECESHDMMSPTDYRRLAQHQRGLYFVTASRNEDLYEDFIELADGVTPKATSIEVMMGRQLQVPMAAGKACMFSFPDLCSKAVAAADYLAVAQNFHTLALSGVPVFKGANRSEGYRFVTLIDVMYEHRVRMLMSAEAMPFELFEDILTQQEAAEKPQLLQGRDVVVDDNLGFAKDRTISRMTEMQSLEYLLAHAKSYAPHNVLALQEARAKAIAAHQA